VDVEEEDVVHLEEEAVELLADVVVAHPVDVEEDVAAVEVQEVLEAEPRPFSNLTDILVYSSPKERTTCWSRRTSSLANLYTVKRG